MIAQSIGSLAAQDYPGPFRIVLVDDGSSDGTAELARRAGGARLTVSTGAPLLARLDRQASGRFARASPPPARRVTCG